MRVRTQGFWGETALLLLLATACIARLLLNAKDRLPAAWQIALFTAKGDSWLHVRAGSLVGLVAVAALLYAGMRSRSGPVAAAVGILGFSLSPAVALAWYGRPADLWLPLAYATGVCVVLRSWRRLSWKSYVWLVTLSAALLVRLTEGIAKRETLPVNALLCIAGAPALALLARLCTPLVQWMLCMALVFSLAGRCALDIRDMRHQGRAWNSFANTVERTLAPGEILYIADNDARRTLSFYGSAAVKAQLSPEPDPSACDEESVLVGSEQSAHDRLPAGCECVALAPTPDFALLTGTRAGMALEVTRIWIVRRQTESARERRMMVP